MQPLLAGTPMHRWAADHVPWKLLSGPLFPQQVDYALQLALLLREGGAVSHATTMMTQEGQREYSRQLTSCPLDTQLVALQGDIGDTLSPHPALLLSLVRNSDVIVSLLEHLASQLDICREAGVCLQTAGELMASWWGESCCTASSADCKPSPHCSAVCILPLSVVSQGTCKAAPLAALKRSANDTSSFPASAASSAPMVGAISFSDCARESLSGGIEVGSALSQALSASEKDTCRHCRTLPQWHGGKQRVWAAMGYSTQNIGDDVQALASVAFLPRVDAFVDRDSFDVVPHPGLGAELITDTTDVHFFGNAWWKHKVYAANGQVDSTKCAAGQGNCGPPELRWPMPPRLHPFTIAMHLSVPLATDDGLRALVEYQALALRDEASAVSMREAGGEAAFFAACMTLTLRRPHLLAPPPKRSGIFLAHTSYFNDTALLLSIVPSRLHHQVKWIDQDVPERWNFSSPLRYLLDAEDRLAELASARLVLTTRLHVLLPCLAMGVPVVFVSKPENAADIRFSGYASQLAPVTSPEDPRLATLDWDADVPALGDGGAAAELRSRAAAVLGNLLLQQPEVVRAAGLVGSMPQSTRSEMGLPSQSAE
jgi:Polysaccharide pyruvyl transferase